jgi:hypothetical protein
VLSPPSSHPKLKFDYIQCITNPSRFDNVLLNFVMEFSFRFFVFCNAVEAMLRLSVLA